MFHHHSNNLDLQQDLCLTFFQGLTGLVQCLVHVHFLVSIDHTLCTQIVKCSSQQVSTLTVAMFACANYFILIKINLIRDSRFTVYMDAK